MRMSGWSPFEFYLVKIKFFGNLSNMSVSRVVDSLIKHFKKKIISALTSINACENLVKMLSWHKRN